MYEIHVDNSEDLADVCSELIFRRMSFSARKVAANDWRIEIFERETTRPPIAERK